jgi:hemolysin-activating ACP:hemolysin acyltransferase
MALSDLEWLLLPPLMSGQLVTLRAKVKNAEGLLLPLALGLWAKVSPEADAKLEAQKAAGLQPRLAPQDWISGSIPWLVVSVGPKELLPRLQEQLSGTLGDGMKVFG